MKACRLSLLCVMLLCTGIALAIPVVGFGSTVTKADDIYKEEIVCTTLPRGIVGDIVESIPAPGTIIIAKAEKKKEEEKKKAEAEKKKAEKKNKPASPPDPTDPDGCIAACCGCWDY